MGDTAWEELQRQQYAAMSDAYQRGYNDALAKIVGYQTGREDALREVVAWLRSDDPHGRIEADHRDRFRIADAIERGEHEAQTLHTSASGVEDSEPDTGDCLCCDQPVDSAQYRADRFLTACGVCGAARFRDCDPDCPALEDYRKPSECERCGGERVINCTGCCTAHPCPDCGGTGKPNHCPSCRGSGDSPHSGGGMCPVCDGTGKRKE